MHTYLLSITVLSVTASQVTMELETCAFFLAAVVLGGGATFLLATACRRRRHRRFKLPPGPRPLPIIGNLHHLGPLPHVTLHELSLRYGPLVYLRLGTRPVVAGSSVAMARFFLKTHDLKFVDRPTSTSAKHTMYDHSGMLWSPYGPYWRHLRRLFQAELFTPARLQSQERVRGEECRAMLRGLRRAAGAGRAVEVRDHLFMLNLNVVSRMVFGKKYVGDEAGGGSGVGSVTTPEEFKWMLDELFLLNGVVNIGDFIPWLNWLDLQGYIRRMKRLRKMLDRFLDHVLDDHVERRERDGEGFVEMDIVDVLLQQANDPWQDVQINRDNVKGFILDLLAAGTDTSSVGMEWAVAELIRRPEAMAKAVEELDRVVGGERLVTEKDAPQLPYLDAVVKETLRLHPPGPMLGPRQSREDTSVAGHDIPAGTRVLVNVWSMGRDPALWDSPEEFLPERFLGSKKKIDVRGQDFELLPFGAGRRMCPGYGLALKMMLVALGNLLHGFAWRLPDGVTKEDVSMEEKLGLSLRRKGPLEVAFEPRLPAHLYATD